MIASIGLPACFLHRFNTKMKKRLFLFLWHAVSKLIRRENRKKILQALLSS